MAKENEGLIGEINAVVMIVTILAGVLDKFPGIPQGEISKLIDQFIEQYQEKLSGTDQEKKLRQIQKAMKLIHPLKGG